MNAPVNPRSIHSKGIVYHPNVAQGTDEWLEMRRGLLTASEMKFIITPTLKIASNERERSHLYNLLAQRTAGYVEPGYVSYDMMRGAEDEGDARILYSANYEAVEECGFITNDKWGFTLGYSPDGLVGSDGLIEAKSRAHKFQVETLLENVPAQTVPADFILQVQTGLLVSERKWCDFISYSAGLPMATIRAHPDPVIQAAILAAAEAFEDRMLKRIVELANVMNSKARLIPTARRQEQEIRL